MNTIKVDVNEVGSFFAMQYYEVIQQSPHLGHQFYSGVSSVIFIDGDVEKTANSTMEIHALLSTLNFTSIEIRTLHSLHSWRGCVLVAVSGYVQMKEYNGKRKFSQTVLLAPQEKGFFVLNDVFHIFNKETTIQPSDPFLGHHNYYDRPDMRNHHVLDPDLPYTGEEEIYTENYLSHNNVHEKELQSTDNVDTIQEYEIDSVDKYRVPEPQQFPESSDDKIIDEIHVEEPVATIPSTVEPVGHQPKQTYASILRFAKAQPSNSIPPAPPANKTTQVFSDTQNATSQQSWADNSTPEFMQDNSTVEDDGEAKFVYLGNLSSSITVSDIERKFENFGKIKENGISLRPRKDLCGFYAFVEYEDVTGAQNAIQASPVYLNGRNIYVNPKRPNYYVATAGEGRGRGAGRGGYYSEASNGRHGGRGLSRGEWVPSTRNGHNPTKTSF